MAILLEARRVHISPLVGAAAASRTCVHRIPLMAGHMSSNASEMASLRWARGALETRSIRRHGDRALSGRCIVVVSTHHAQSQMCYEGGIATMVLCHSLARICARPGDVIVVISAVNTRRSYGIGSTDRLVLSVLLVSQTYAPYIYYSLGAPAWVRGRADRVYRAVLAGRTAAQQRNTGTTFSGLDNGTVLPVRSVDVRDGGWRVAHGRKRNADPILVQYTLRAHPRFHGADVITDEERTRDFRGRVLMGRQFANFPGDANVRGATRCALRFQTV